MDDAGHQHATYDALPGWELVEQGVRDVDAGRTTVSALLVRSASTRLGALGVSVPPLDDDDGVASLYDLVAAEVGSPLAHSRYNAIRRRLAAFLRLASRARAG